MGGVTYLRKEYNIPDTSMIRMWANAYSGFGDEGLLYLRKIKNILLDLRFMKII